MDINHLKAFVMIAKKGQITKASRLLFISQPAVSAHIKALENETGVKLFYRIANGMQLTENGKILLVEAETILNSIEHFKRLASECANKVHGEICLGLHSDSALGEISEFIATLKLNYNNLNIDLCEILSGIISSRVIDKSISAGFILGPAIEKDLECLLLEPINLYVVGPRDYEEKFHSIKNWKDIAKLPWIYTSRDCGHYRTLKHFFKRLGLSMHKQHMTADSPPVLIKFLQHGLGIALMPEGDANLAQKRGEISIWEENHIPTQKSFIYRKDRKNDPLITTLLQSVTQHWSLS